jgi:hypothetical protein
VELLPSDYMIREGGPRRTGQQRDKTGRGQAEHVDRKSDLLDIVIMIPSP